MSRSKKTRTMKGKLNIKTGSKKDFFKEGEKGNIPSHNRLAKHKKRQKSAYQQFLEENKQVDTSAGQQAVQERIKKAEEKAIESDKSQQKTKEHDSSKDFDKLSGDELLDLFNK